MKSTFKYVSIVIIILGCCKLLFVIDSILRVSCFTVLLQTEILRMQKELREKQNVVNEKEEELFELGAQQVSHETYSFDAMPNLSFSAFAFSNSVAHLKVVMLRCYVVDYSLFLGTCISTL